LAASLPLWEGEPLHTSAYQKLLFIFSIAGFIIEMARDVEFAGFIAINGFVDAK